MTEPCGAPHLSGLTCTWSRRQVGTSEGDRAGELCARSPSRCEAVPRGCRRAAAERSVMKVPARTGRKSGGGGAWGVHQWVVKTSRSVHVRCRACANDRSGSGRLAHSDRPCDRAARRARTASAGRRRRGIRGRARCREFASGRRTARIAACCLFMAHGSGGPRGAAAPPSVRAQEHGCGLLCSVRTAGCGASPGIYRPWRGARRVQL